MSMLKVRKIIKDKEHSVVKASRGETINGENLQMMVVVLSNKT